MRFRPLTPGGRHRKPTGDLTLTELRRHFGYVEKGLLGRRADVTIPTLSDFTDWIRDRHDVGLVFFDIKVPERRLDLLPQLLRRIDDHQSRAPREQRIILESASLPVVRELLKLGVHAIQTDFPERLRRVAIEAHRQVDLATGE